MASLAEFVGLAFYMGPAGTRARRLKAKEFIYLLGLKPKPKTFGFVIEAHDLPREGRIEVARWLHPGAYPIAPLQVQAAVDQLRRFLRDRKSTRLNSSHGYISYAVFCLKKKTKKVTPASV